MKSPPLCEWSADSAQARPKVARDFLHCVNFLLFSFKVIPSQGSSQSEVHSDL